MTNKPQPVESFKFGNFDFAMWNNQGEDLRTFQSVSIKRTYRDGNGEWQDGGEIRLLPQQLNDLALGSQEMYRYWRLGMKHRKQTDQSEAKTADSQQPAEQQAKNAQSELQTESPEGQGGPEIPPNGDQGELSVVGEQQGFRGKVNESRSAKRSR